MTRSASARPPNRDLLDAAGRVLLVTGAAGGLGREVAALFRQAGARIARVDLREGGETNEEGIDLVADLTSAAETKGVVSACLDAFGRIDFVVHCAGKVGRGPLVEMSLDQWNEELATNLTSAFLLARAVHGALRETHGSLVLVGSPNGIHGGTALSGPAYAAAKAGVINLARYLAKEWAPHVRVNCVVPGTVDTPMLQRLSPSERDELTRTVPLGRLIEADEVAAAIAFLCSPHASGMTGSILNVSGGRLLI